MNFNIEYVRSQYIILMFLQPMCVMGVKIRAPPAVFVPSHITQFHRLVAPRREIVERVRNYSDLITFQHFLCEIDPIYLF